MDDSTLLSSYIKYYRIDNSTVWESCRWYGHRLKLEELTLDVRTVFFECVHIINNFSILLLTSRRTKLTVKCMIKKIENLLYLKPVGIKVPRIQALE